MEIIIYQRKKKRVELVQIVQISTDNFNFTVLSKIKEKVLKSKALLAKTSNNAIFLYYFFY